MFQQTNYFWRFLIFSKLTHETSCHESIIFFSESLQGLFGLVWFGLRELNYACDLNMQCVHAR